MSQSNPDAVDADDSISTDKHALALAEHVSAMRERLDAMRESEIEAMDDVDLVELRTEIKELEDSVEDARKSVVDDELQDRIEPGESLLGLNHIESHNKGVSEDTGTIIMRAVSNGIDYTQFVSINASTLADVAPEIAEIEEYPYTYLR
jgi:hypothetical protein